jgi:16S rRNA (guanine527-N7)-methyltransferase
MIRPDLSVQLVESDERKATFLRTVSRETNTPVLIHMGRIETLPATPAPDAVTARALADLKTLLDWTWKWAGANPALTYILPKGRQAEAEIDAARAHYSFVLEDRPSLTDPEARILRLAAVTRVSA